MLVKIKQKINTLSNDSLFRNSIYLILATAVMSGLGFVFWIFGARLFTTEQIGVASSLISVMGIATSLSLLGFNNSIIKYLPIAKSPDKVFRNAITLTGIASLSAAMIALVVVRISNPALRFITHSAWLSVLFVLFTLFSTLNILFDNTFIALRTSKNVLYKNTILSLVKLASPLLLVGLAAFGIFTSIGIGTLCACLYGIYYLSKHELHFRPSIEAAVIKPMMKFSLGNYLVSVFNGLPALIIPLLIINKLGATASGYYYIDYLIIALLFVIPSAASNSFFAEGAQKDAKLKPIIISVIKIAYGLLIPAIIAIVFLGPIVLSILGKSYSTDGTHLLRILAVSGIFVAFNNLAGSFLNLHHKVKELIVVNLLGIPFVLGSVALCMHSGLSGVGYGWTIGQALVSITYLIFIWTPLRSIFSKTATSNGVIA